MKIENNRNSHELDSLKQQKSKLMENENAEMESIKSYYKDQKEKARLGYVEELGSMQDAQTQELLTKIDQYQERLNQKLDAYRKEEADLEKSRLAMMDANKQEIQNIRSEFLENRDFQFQNALAENVKLRQSNDEVLRKSRRDVSNVVADRQRETASILDRQALEHDARIRRSANLFKQTTATHEKEKETMLENMKQQTAKDIQFDSTRAQNLINGHRKINESQMVLEQEKFKTLLNQQREIFLNRYNALKAANDRVINHASSKLAGGLDDLQAKLIHEKELIEVKGKDPFYHPTFLQPKIEDAGKYYLVHLEMPEHEKEFVMFNANQRTLKLSFTRKMAQNFQMEDGSLNKSNRSELVTKEISVPEIVDAKTVKQKYENGVLTFRVLKA
ncbi:MAG: hypothetical protein HYV97_08545 [Bdellovibrio sp.]|nr:hypothetical protein [Bdellovibrio sp.]